MGGIYLRFKMLQERFLATCLLLWVKVATRGNRIGLNRWLQRGKSMDPECTVLFPASWSDPTSTQPALQLTRSFSLATSGATRLRFATNLSTGEILFGYECKSSANPPSSSPKMVFTINPNGVIQRISFGVGTNRTALSGATTWTGTTHKHLKSKRDGQQGQTD